LQVSAIWVTCRFVLITKRDTPIIVSQMDIN